MSVCLFASEYAAVVGQNPYRHPVLVLFEVWKRFDAASFHNAQHRVSQSRHNVEIETLDSADCVLDHVVRSNEELNKVVQDMTKVLSRGDTPLAKVLVDSRAQVTKVMKKDVESGKISQQREQEVVKRITSQLQQHYGKQREPVTIRDLGVSVKNNNDKFYVKTLFNIPEGAVITRVNLGGRIDGLVDDRLIEIKNRKSRFMVPVPQYDLIQLHCYMILLKKKQADLIEHLPSGKKKTTLVGFDPVLWNRTLTGAAQFIQVLNILLADPEAQFYLLSCGGDAEAQSEWYDAMLPSTLPPPFRHFIANRQDISEPRDSPRLFPKQQQWPANPDEPLLVTHPNN